MLTKVLVIGTLGGANVHPLEQNPTVIYTGSEEGCSAIKAAIDAGLAAATNQPTGMAYDSTEGIISVGIVSVEDYILIGDTLDLDSAVYKKHV